MTMIVNATIMTMIVMTMIVNAIIMTMIVSGYAS